MVASIFRQEVELAKICKKRRVPKSVQFKSHFNIFGHNSLYFDSLESAQLHYYFRQMNVLAAQVTFEAHISQTDEIFCEAADLEVAGSQWRKHHPGQGENQGEHRDGVFAQVPQRVGFRHLDENRTSEVEEQSNG